MGSHVIALSLLVVIYNSVIRPVNVTSHSYVYISHVKWVYYKIRVRMMQYRCGNRVPHRSGLLPQQKEMISDYFSVDIMFTICCHLLVKNHTAYISTIISHFRHDIKHIKIFSYLDI